MAQALPKSARCMSCSYVTNDEADFLEHAGEHMYDNNFRIACMHCTTKLKNPKSYRRHRKICRLNPANQNSDQNEVIEDKDSIEKIFWQCEICEHKEQISSPQVFDDFQRIFEHLFDHTKNKCEVSCPVCKLEGIHVTYQKYKSLHKHYTKHKNYDEFSVIPIEHLEPFENEAHSFLEAVDNDFNGTPESSNLNESIEVENIVEQKQKIDKIDIPALNRAIKHQESVFALKMTAKVHSFLKQCFAGSSIDTKNGVISAAFQANLR